MTPMWASPFAPPAERARTTRGVGEGLTGWESVIRNPVSDPPRSDPPRRTVASTFMSVAVSDGEPQRVRYCEVAPTGACSLPS